MEIRLIRVPAKGWCKVLRDPEESGCLRMGGKEGGVLVHLGGHCDGGGDVRGREKREG